MNAKEAREIVLRQHAHKYLFARIDEIITEAAHAGLVSCDVDVTVNQSGVVELYLARQGFNCEKMPGFNTVHYRISW